MYFILFTLFLTTSQCDNITHNGHPESRYAINDISYRDLVDGFIHLLAIKKDSTRAEELKSKLNKIETYVTDKDSVVNSLKNVLNKTDLNETNFFKDLYENDSFKFLSEAEPKSLYLKMKEKMNRDDIMKMFIERGGKSKLVRSARKAMDGDNIDNDFFEEVVDKMIAEMPADDHKYNAAANESIYWDPQGELEDLNEYHRHDGRRIFKGERTTVRYYPFMVSVHVMGRFWCGGVIYWHDLILTSAACLQLMHNNRFFRENPKVLQVRIGSNHSRIGGEVVDALEVYFHPAYNPRTLRNNIAVIRLRRHLFFNYHRIPKVIDISHNGDGMPATAEVMLLGWGVTKNELCQYVGTRHNAFMYSTYNDMSQKLSYEPIFLQRKFLPVYPNKFCKEVYGDKFITSTMFCAGTFTTGEGACDHDAGGPAILNGRLVGIISFGPTVCGFPNAPTVFTLVGAYADWIETINETMPGYYRGKKRTTTTTPSSLMSYFATWVNLETSSASLHPPVIPTKAPVILTPTTSPSPSPSPEATTPGLRLARDDETDDGWSIDLKK